MYKDSKVRKQRQHEWYLKNKERLNKLSRQYYYSHKEKILALNKMYRESHVEKFREYQNAYTKRHPERKRNSFLQWMYGISLEDFNKKYTEQGGKCAICGDTAKLILDHSHKTDKVRELLCKHCNHLLGFARDDIFILQNAIQYLKDHPDENIPEENNNGISEIA